MNDLDFSSGGAYAVYNWELFFHVPLTIAMHLSRNGRYDEAQRWFHHLFDPTDDSDGPTPERFWKVKPFQTTDVRQIEEILINLSTNGDPHLRARTVNSIGAWKDAPFRPHVVARYRQSAYMFKTVMAYLDNLIAWGDGLFRQDTRESINEAMQLYVLAANILGPRPQAVPKKGDVRPQTYANLRSDLDAFSNALRDLETALPFDVLPSPPAAMGDREKDQFDTLRSMGEALYFCIPRNDKMLGYWDTVADRLFKIRNSLNLQGIFRQLPLFAPPIDPALLARAAAAGLDVAAVVAEANAPLPLVRFGGLIQKAVEICQEVKSLGTSLLSAIEKEDNEAIAVMRARHERVVLALAESVRYAQWQEAIKAREGMEVTLANAVQRYTYYERLLGKRDEEITVPGLDPLSAEDLGAMRFKANEPDVTPRGIDVDIAQDLGESGGKIVSSHEAEEMHKQELSRDIQDIARITTLAAQAISVLPDFGIKFHFWGLGGDATYGGTNISATLKLAADVSNAVADRLNYEAGRAAKIGLYARREQEWAYQSNVAAGDITQIFKQLRAAQIREAVTEREWKNHQQQIRNAEEVEQFLTDERTGKTTRKAFYTWLRREVKGLYGQCFDLAFDVAKKAERALRHEVGDPGLSFLQYGYRAGHEGLLAGDRLYFDLKRMELAYHELNRREYEITKHISVLQVAPAALVQLRLTGSCTIALPEELFDMDGPGHYFRRLKSLAVTIPCVAGPYTSINCTVVARRSSIRIDPVLGDDYARAPGDDSRFRDYHGSLQAIVTSSGQNDSGLFETDLRDERYLPFEGAGVISEWGLQLPADRSKGDPSMFDYDTIADVVLHLRYTARDGGELLRNGAKGNLRTAIEEARAAGSTRLFSVRHEFPTEWARFNGPAREARTLTLRLRREHFPFWGNDRIVSIRRVEVLARAEEETIRIRTPDDREIALLGKSASFGGLLVGHLTALPEVTPDPEVVVTFDLVLPTTSIADLWLAVTWGATEE